MARRKPHIGIIRSEEYADNPWHFKKFVKGEINSLPFDKQHESVVFYHGSNSSDFYTEENTPTGNHQQKSVLRSKVKMPGNMNREKGRTGLDEFTYDNDGIFGGTLETSLNYTNRRHNHRGLYGIIWELELPVSAVKMMIGKKSGKWLGLNLPSDKPYYHCENSEQIIQILGGSRNSRDLAIGNLRKLIEKSVKKSARGGSRYDADQIHFATPFQVNLDQVTGFWPLKYSKKPLFLSKKEFVEYIYSDSDIRSKLPEEKLPKSIEEFERSEESLKELENLRTGLQNLENIWIKLKRQLERLIMDLENIYELESSKTRKIKFFAEYSWYRKALGRGKKHPWKNLRHNLYGEKYNGQRKDNYFTELLGEFNQKISQILEFNRKYLNADIKRPAIGTIVELEYLKDKDKDSKDSVKVHLQGLLNSIEKIEQIEKKRLQGHKIDTNEHKKLEERTERAIQQHMKNIPNLEPLEMNLDKTNFEKFVEENIAELDNIE